MIDIDFGSIRRHLLIFAVHRLGVAIDVAEDLAQEALLRTFKHSDRMQSQKHAEAYATLSVKHRRWEEERLRRKFFVEWNDDEWETALDTLIPAPDNQYQALLLDQMMEYIESCSNAELDAVLATAAGYTPEEIAKHSTFRAHGGIAMQNVKTAVGARVKRGRAHLREVFA